MKRNEANLYVGKFEIAVEEMDTALSAEAENHADPISVETAKTLLKIAQKTVSIWGMFSGQLQTVITEGDEKNLNEGEDDESGGS